MTASTGRLAALQAGAVLLVVAGFAPWLGAGSGDAVSGYDLARAVGELGETEGVPPAWVGAGWYLLPLTGFAAWLALYLPARPVPWLHLVLGGLGTLFCVGFVVAVLRAGGSVGWGAFVALVGSLVLLAGGWWARSSATRPPVPF